MNPFVLIWGGGDLASGVAFRLHKVGMRLLIVETKQPTAVRLSVSFAKAVFDGRVTIEDVTGQLIDTPDALVDAWEKQLIPVLVDPELRLLETHRPLVLVDARMRKMHSALSLNMADLVVGLGPGFIAGENCHAAIETNRGHFLGRVYWQGSPEVDTGLPGQVQTYTRERVLYAPAEGDVKTTTAIGDIVKAGDPVLSVDGIWVQSPFDGVVRGLIHDGVSVKEGVKVGDVDPRPDAFRCTTVSEKSLAIGGGVMEAILTREAIRTQLWKA